MRNVRQAGGILLQPLYGQKAGAGVQKGMSGKRGSGRKKHKEQEQLNEQQKQKEEVEKTENEEKKLQEKLPPKQPQYKTNQFKFLALLGTHCLSTGANVKDADEQEDEDEDVDVDVRMWTFRKGNNDDDMLHRGDNNNLLHAHKELQYMYTNTCA
ncbi:hypothetical protein ACLKA6_004284 [Drosophila palustris]